MQLKNRIKSIAIGSFDGIHLGHQALINQVEAVLIIERNEGVLTSGYRRSFYVNKPCFFYHFEKIQALNAKAFVEKINIDFPCLETIVIGYDFSFAYKKEGNAGLLKELFDGEVKIISEVSVENISVHSKIIKEYLGTGDINMVSKLLGRPFRIEGKVVSGQGLGKKELVPTLNLSVKNYRLPKDGVYTSYTKIKNEWLLSVTFLGHRVTTDGSFAVESYVLDRDIGIVTGFIEIEFVKFIRENQKFNGLEALKKQIQEDILEVKKEKNEFRRVAKYN